MMQKAVDAKIISTKQADDLINFFQKLPNQSPGFNLTNVLYYFGGLLAIGAMSLFINLGWELYGSWGILSLSMCYAILGLALVHVFDKKQLIIPAGICATFVICLIPIAIYSFQKGMGLWPDDTIFQQYNLTIKWHWIFMELGTLAGGLILIWFYRYPFMVMPIAVTLWYMSMDITPMLTGGEYTFDLSAKVSMYFGLITLLIAFWVDLRSIKSADFAFWIYIFGILAFWGGLTAQHSDFELSKFLYLCVNLLLILIGIILNRKVFVVFGGLGSCIYISHLTYEVFKDSYLFPIVLTLVGLAVIYLGILWQKHEAHITASLQSMLPKTLKDLMQK
jgi:hypothetical protein